MHFCPSDTCLKTSYVRQKLSEIQFLVEKLIWSANKMCTCCKDLKGYFFTTNWCKNLQIQMHVVISKLYICSGFNFANLSMKTYV